MCQAWARRASWSAAVVQAECKEKESEPQDTTNTRKVAIDAVGLEVGRIRNRYGGGKGVRKEEVTRAVMQLGNVKAGAIGEPVTLICMEDS